MLLQASFSTASHSSLDSVDDEVDFKIDDKLRRQIEKTNRQSKQETLETQLEVKQVFFQSGPHCQYHKAIHSRSSLTTIYAHVLQDEVEGKGELVAAFIGAAVLFGIGVWGVAGAEKAQEYFAGYLLEQSLSVDNLFVFILVFKYFKTPRLDQEKVWVSTSMPAGFVNNYLHYCCLLMTRIAGQPLVCCGGRLPSVRQIQTIACLTC